jgi:hypothetical protein
MPLMMQRKLGSYDNGNGNADELRAPIIAYGSLYLSCLSNNVGGYQHVVLKPSIEAGKTFGPQDNLCNLKSIVFDNA